MSHKYNLRSRNNSPSDRNLEDQSNNSNTATSSSSSNKPASLGVRTSSSSPYFTGFVPYFIPTYNMENQGNQVDLVSGSQDNLDVNPEFEHDAQDLLDNLVDRTQEDVYGTIDNAFKRNQIDSF